MEFVLLALESRGTRPAAHCAKIMLRDKLSRTRVNHIRAICGSIEIILKPLHLSSAMSRPTRDQASDKVASKQEITRVCRSGPSRSPTIGRLRAVLLISVSRGWNLSRYKGSIVNVKHFQSTQTVRFILVLSYQYGSICDPSTRLPPNKPFALLISIQLALIILTVSLSHRFFIFLPQLATCCRNRKSGASASFTIVRTWTSIKNEEYQKPSY